MIRGRDPQRRGSAARAFVVAALLPAAAAAGGPDSLAARAAIPVDSTFAAPDSAAASESLVVRPDELATLEAQAADLGATERVVFAELVAAVREMRALGDEEAANLLLEDARRLLRTRSP